MFIHRHIVSFLFILGLTVPCVSQAAENSLSCGMPFDDFLIEMKGKALKRGIPLKTVTDVLFHTEILPEVIKLDRDQKAFRMSFTRFSDRSVSDYRLIHGKKKLKRHRALFDIIWNKYGIPPEVILSFWAMETDYGVVQGNFHTLSSLATLANDCRRSDLFQLQYLDAMQLVQDKILDAEKSVGAWAGEFGQIQMLPSDIIAFGVDGDGDGKVQLDRSTHDTILTAARLIVSKGWKPQQRWFEEVSLSEGFPWYEAGLGRSRSLKEWMKLGLKPRNFSALDSDLDAITSLILPQGRKGPKFLAYPNFNIFMQWNDSFMYSTTAAYLANRLKGDLEFASDDPKDILNFDEMVDLQEILYGFGYDVGKIDGILGAKTRQSVRLVQMNLGLPADSWPTIQLLEALRSIGAN